MERLEITLIKGIYYYSGFDRSTHEGKYIPFNDQEWGREAYEEQMKYLYEVARI